MTVPSAKSSLGCEETLPTTRPAPLSSASALETPLEAPEVIDSEAQRHLLANIDRARELGAEVVRLKSTDPAAALLDFARSHRVSDVIIGRTDLPWWRRLLRASVLERLVRDGAGLDLHIVSFFEEEPHP